MSRILSEDIAVQARRERVTESYLRGMKQSEIAAREDTTQATISRDLLAVRKVWRQSAIRNYNEDINRELDRIDLLERTYWEAWQRSTSERQKSKTKRRTGITPYDEAGVEREQRDGNPAFLAGVMACIEKRCKILGLDAPEKHEHSGTLAIEERRSRLDTLLDSLRQRAGTGGTGIPADGFSGGNN